MLIELTDAQGKFLFMTLIENAQVRHSILSAAAPYGKQLYDEIVPILGCAVVGLPATHPQVIEADTPTNLGNLRGTINDSGN
jgi:hypothetical protein